MLAVSIEGLAAAAEREDISEERLTESVTRIIDLKKRLGLFASPSPDPMGVRTSLREARLERGWGWK